VRSIVRLLPIIGAAYVDRKLTRFWKTRCDWHFSFPKSSRLGLAWTSTNQTNQKIVKRVELM